MKRVRELTKRYRLKIAGILFWLIIWQLLSLWVDLELLLPSPTKVLFSLVSLMGKESFWSSIGSSLGKISFGFFLAVTVGIGLSVCSAYSSFVKEIITVAMRIIKSIPVVSFVILMILWVRISNLSIAISFLTVLPIIYTNVVKGVESTDPKLLEMARVFGVKGKKKLRYIYVPSVVPFFVSACSVGVGFCWKSGIAAEVIGLQGNSIGEKLYEAKLYMMTKELFAWTIVIVAISVLFEKLVMIMIRKLEHKLTN